MSRIFLSVITFFGCSILHAKNEAFVSSNIWKNVQKKSEMAIVQIIAQVADEDVFQPYSKYGTEGRGSGSLIEGGRGLILTNYHVVENGVAILVQMPLLFGKKMLPAHIVGVCPDYDIALLQLEDEVCDYIEKVHGTIPSLPLGDSNKVDRSDQLLGLGFPLGQESLKSVTGVVSGYEHVTSHAGFRFNSCYAIQVSTPLNPGSSGGPVLNEEGEVVGINMSAASDAQNVGYVIFINYYKLLAESLKQGGLVRKPSIGLSMCRAKDNELAQLYNNPVPAGCFITHVVKGGLADSFGILEGDMIYTINGLAIDPYGCVRMSEGKDRLYVEDYVAFLSLGQDLTIELYRQGVKHVVTGKLTLTEEPAIHWKYAPYEIADYEIIGGLLIQELSLNIISCVDNTRFGEQFPAIKARLACYKEIVKREDPVLMVTYMFPSSEAAYARSFDRGALIKEVNGKEVKTLEQMRSILRSEESAQQQFITFKSHDHDVMAFKKDILIANESRLSQSFGYPITPYMLELMQA